MAAPRESEARALFAAMAPGAQDKLLHIMHLLLIGADASDAIVNLMGPEDAAPIIAMVRGAWQREARVG